MNRPQLPGRIEALRVILRDPGAPPELRRIAGLHRAPQRQPSRPTPPSVTFGSGIESMAPNERSALPF